MSTLEEQFKFASEHFGKVYKTLPDKTKLKMYALFNQATTGDVKSKVPSRLDPVKHAKHTAWKKCSGMPKEVAMKRYISELRANDNSFKLPSETAEIVSKTSSPEQLQKDFLAATKFVKSRGTGKLPKQQQTLLYAYYKQATDGVCSREKPGLFSNDQRKRGWKAWANLFDMSKEDAKKRYLEMVVKSYPTEKLTFKSLSTALKTFSLRKDSELENMRKEDEQIKEMMLNIKTSEIDLKLKNAIESSSDIAFITGATGFIGKHFLDLVLNHEHYNLLHSYKPIGQFGRYMDKLKYGKSAFPVGLQGKSPVVICFVRDKSRTKLISQILNRNGKDSVDKVIVLSYSLDKKNYGLPQDILKVLKKHKLAKYNQSSVTKNKRESVRLFHFAAKYSLQDNGDENTKANVSGTKYTIEFCKSHGIKLEYVSSVVVAGDHNGMFLETSFDEGQDFRDGYSRSKYEAEKLVRSETKKLNYTIYRPGVVVGHSVTGEADKIDGPYFFFKFLQNLRTYLPDSFILPLIDGETMPVVPVDYVARSIFHIGFGVESTESLQKTFHLVDSSAKHSPDSLIESLNIFAKAAHAPTFSAKANNFILSVIPKKFSTAIQNIPLLRDTPIWLAKNILNIPEEALNYTLNTTTYDDSDAQYLLGAAGIKCPSLRDYADKLWDFYERYMDLANINPFAALVREIKGKNVLITGATDGIGLALAHKMSKAEANVIIVGRNPTKLKKCVGEIQKSGKENWVKGYQADLAEEKQTNKMLVTVLKECGYVDVLINNAGRSIRRSVEYEWLGTNRFHDFERTMALNYFGALRCILGLVQSMRERKNGQIINISSIGVATNQARFGAYAASKSALDGFTRCVSAECAADNVHFSTVYMPLVKTKMIEAEGHDYEHFGNFVLDLDQACDLICEAVVKRERTIAPLWVRAVMLAYHAFPSVVESVNSLLYRLEPEHAPKGVKDSARANGDREQLKAIVGLFKGGWQ